MIGYKKNFLEFWNLSEYDDIPDMVNGLPAQDLHHLNSKRSGGSSQGLDAAWNTVPVTRKNHNRAHDDPEFNEGLKRTHLVNICNYIADRLGLDCTINIDFGE